MLAQDVISYSILPYVSMEDLLLEKDKNPTLAQEYERRIQDLLENGEDYQILTAALETQEPALLHRFFDDIIGSEELDQRIEDAVMNSLNNQSLDLLEALSKYNVVEVEKYIPLYILFPHLYQRYTNDSVSNKMTFNEYLYQRRTSYDADRTMKAHLKEAVENIAGFEDATIARLLLLPKYQRDIPINFLIEYGYGVPFRILIDTLAKVKTQMPDRYQEFLDSIVENRDIGLIPGVTPAKEAKEIYDLTRIVYGF